LFLHQTHFPDTHINFNPKTHIKFHLQRWDHADLVERPKLDMSFGVEIDVRVRKVGLVKKQILVRILAPMSYLKC
jgi:hypothetical protein